MMSFVFAPAAKNKPNLQNVFTSMTLSIKLPPLPPPPNNLGLYICLLTFVLFFVCLFVCLFRFVLFLFLFFLGFSIRCERTITGDFAKVTKMAHGGKPFFLFGYILMTNEEA